MAEGVGHVGAVLRSETDAKLAERDEAIRELQERTTECERVLGIRRDEYHKIWLEVMKSGDYGLLYAWQEEHGITNAMIAEWERQERLH